MSTNLSTMSHFQMRSNPSRLSRFLDLGWGLLIAWLCLLSLAPRTWARQSPGTVDLSFNAADDGSYGNGYGPDKHVLDQVAQSDGKIVLGGVFTGYNGATVSYLTRVNPDGTRDASFNALGTGPNNLIRALAIQPDGKLLIGGDFTSYNGIACGRVARLNSDGSLDTSYISGVGADGLLSDIVLQPDGKAVLAGAFTKFNGAQRRRVARLNADGTLDGTFVSSTHPATGASHEVKVLQLQPDGRIWIAGAFTHFSGVARNRIALLNANGTLDTSFNPISGVDDGVVSALGLQSDGKLLIGGTFATYNGISSRRLVRVNATGERDTSFNTGTGFSSGDVYVISVLPGGQVLIGGDFYAYNGSPCPEVVRLSAFGAMDTTFVAYTYPFSVPLKYNRIHSILQQPNGTLLVGGGYENGDDHRGYFDRWNSNGSKDWTFNRGTGLTGYAGTIIQQPDGKLLVGGPFVAYNGVPKFGIMRLNADGTLDPEFNPGSGPNGAIKAVALQPDGKIMIAGEFEFYNGIAIPRVARLNSDGSLDGSFNPGLGPDSPVYSMLLQPDGKLLIQGGFSLYDGTNCRRLARLNSNGTLDTSFNIGSGPDDGIYAIALQPDGKVLIGGFFSSFNGTPALAFARLNSNGSVDTSFNAGGSGFDNTVTRIAIQSDGKILVSGLFTAYNGTARSGLLRMNANGGLDATFNPGLGARWQGAASDVAGFLPMPDGKILIAGYFDSYNGTPCKFGARINSNGSFDGSLVAGSGLDSGLSEMTLQSDGKILISGGFTQVNGTPRIRIARVFASDPFVEFCFGDGSAGAACPCGNTGLADRGCNNSVGTGGGKLAGSGGPGNDTVVLTASGLLPTALTIFLQGTSSVATPAVFGDGLRCTGGALKRLYVKPASGGIAAAPSGTEPSVKTQSAALGDPILPGATRYYQAYYRDANASFCPTPSGGTYNITNAMSILWQ